MSEDVELTVDGKAHGGWQTVEIKLGIEDLAGSFTVGYRDKWAERGEPFPIREDDEVVLTVEGERVLTGYVFDYSVSYDKDGGVKLSASGRGKAADLLDCSERYAPSVKQTPIDISADMLDPFGIRIGITDPRLQLDPKISEPIDRFAVEPGETVADALLRLWRLRGCLLQSTPKGDLEVVRAGVSRIEHTVLRFGDNVKRADYSSSTSSRFSKYTLLAQMPGTDQWNGTQMTDIVATVDDAGVPRHRPTVINESEPVDFGYLEQRGKWERNNRAGRAQRLTYGVQGFRHAPQRSGALAAVDTRLGLRAPAGVWRPNHLVRCVDDVIGVDGYQLIAGVTLSRSVEGGKATSLELVPKETYDILELPPLFVPKKRRKKR